MADNNSNTNNISITVKKDSPPAFKSTMEDIKDDGQRIPRGSDRSLINGSGSVRVSEDGSISLSSGKLGTAKMNSGGKTAITNLETEISTNTFSVKTNDLIVNNHKLNNKLYELADFKKVLNGYDDTPKLVGGLTMLGTVLVKAWEPNLKRYVLVRRQVNVPMFSPSIGGTVINPGIKVQQNTSLVDGIKKTINMSGLLSHADLFDELYKIRQQAINLQEEKTLGYKTSLTEKNAKSPELSSVLLTGQDPAKVPASTVVNNANNSQNKKDQKTSPDAAKAAKAGWSTTTNCPNDPEAYWYKVAVSAHKFYVMKSTMTLEVWDCNTAADKTPRQNRDDTNRTPRGVYALSENPEDMQGYKLKSGCKFPDSETYPGGAPDVFGPYFTEICSVDGVSPIDITEKSIGIHGDYPGEDAKNIILVDAAELDAKPGEGSTHGCIRISNEHDKKFAEHYAKDGKGQFVLIED